MPKMTEFSSKKRTKPHQLARKWTSTKLLGPQQFMDALQNDIKLVVTLSQTNTHTHTAPIWRELVFLYNAFAKSMFHGGGGRVVCGCPSRFPLNRTVTTSPLPSWDLFAARVPGSLGRRGWHSFLRPGKHQPGARTQPVAAAPSRRTLRYRAPTTGR